MKIFRGLSLIELLFIIAVAVVATMLLASHLLQSRKDALNARCVEKLGKIGFYLNRYNKSPNNPAIADIIKLTPEQEMSPEATLIPLIALVRAGSITSAEQVTCPVGGDPVAEFSADPQAPKNLLYYAQKKDLKFSDLVLRNRKGEVMSSYLFTYRYQKHNHKDRVIAGDAAVADGNNSLGYSTNHGDYVKNGKFVFVGGANALFADGQVKSCAEDYTVNGATDTNDIWLSESAGIDPNFKRLSTDIITRQTQTSKLSVIGGVPPVKE